LVLIFVFIKEVPLSTAVLFLLFYLMRSALIAFMQNG